MKFRPQTLDRWIYEKVYIQNEYGITEEMVRDKVVIDIGCHCGYFSKLCLDKGARQVYGFELDKSNINLALENNSEYGERFQAFRCAVWKSGKNIVTKIIDYSDEYPVWNSSYNTGGIGIVFEGGNQKAITISLDSIIRGTIKKSGSVDLLKIDVESSEWPILLTSNYINCVPIIVGEYHEIGGEFDDHDPLLLDLGYDAYDLNLLMEFFTEMNYNFRSTRYFNLNIGQFWATRRY